MLLLVLAATFAVSCGTSKSAPQKKEMGLQFYSMRDTIWRSKGNYLPIMEQVASWGYTSLEAAGTTTENSMAAHRKSSRLTPTRLV